MPGKKVQPGGKEIFLAVKIHTNTKVGRIFKFIVSLITHAKNSLDFASFKSQLLYLMINFYEKRFRGLSYIPQDFFSSLEFFVNSVRSLFD